MNDDLKQSAKSFYYHLLQTMKYMTSYCIESDAATAAKVTVSPLKVGGTRKSILSRKSTGPKLSSADTPGML